MNKTKFVSLNDEAKNNEESDENEINNKVDNFVFEGQSHNMEYENNLNSFFNKALEAIDKESDIRLKIIFHMRYGSYKSFNWREIKKEIFNKTGRLYSNQTCANLLKKVNEIAKEATKEFKKEQFIK